MDLTAKSSQAVPEPVCGDAREIDPLALAVLRTVAYTDVFEYPLTAIEIHRYLVGRGDDLQAVEACLSGTALVPRYLAHADGYYCLSGRETIIEVRHARAAASEKLWPLAIRYGRMLSSVPFVRMVAVTGSLAVDNSAPDGDVDFLIVTRPGCLWRCRAMVKVLQLLDRRFGRALLCPNFFLTEKALPLARRDLYVAHELAQMVPIFGERIYRDMRAANDWTGRILPNAAGPHMSRAFCRPFFPRLKRIGEALADSRFGHWIEDWEGGRKIARYNTYGYGPGDWSEFSREATGLRLNIGRAALTGLADRMTALGLSARDGET